MSLPDGLPVEWLATKINNLTLVPSKVDAKGLKAMVLEGEGSVEFRMVLSALIGEVTGKVIPTENKKMFLSTCLSKLAQSPASSASLLVEEGIDGGSLLDDCPQDPEARLELLSVLCDDCLTNRILEHERYTLMTGAGGGNSGASVGFNVLTEAGAIEVLKKASKDLPMSSGQSASKLILERASSAPRELVSTPIVRQSLLGDKQQETLTSVFNVLYDEHVQRRSVIIERCAVTFNTFCESKESSLDKAELRRQAAARLSKFSPNPLVGVSRVYSFPRVELLAAFEKVSAFANTNFKLRNVRIQVVPDRGGRVNTFNFEGKVETAKARASADLAKKSSNDAQSKQRAKAGMQSDAQRGRGLGGSMGDRTNSSGGMGERSGSHGGGSTSGGGGNGGGTGRGGGGGGGNWNRGGRGAQRF